MNILTIDVGGTSVKILCLAHMRDFKSDLTVKAAK